MSIFRWLAVIVCVLVAGFSLSDTELTGNHSTSPEVAPGQVGGLTLTPSPASTHDPRFATATSIITTATAIVRQMTLTAAANIPPSLTPDPTLSPQEIEALGNQWLRDLEAAVGFSHPALEQIITEISSDADLDFVRSEYVRDYQMDVTVEHITYDETTYAAVNIAVPFPFYDSSHFLMFQFQDDQPLLLSDFSKSPLRMVGGFSDFNNNGHPDLRFFEPPGYANFPPIVMTMIEIRPGGAVIDITPDFGEIYQLDTIDVDDDGVMEFRATGCIPYPRFFYSCKASGTNYTQFYRWDGSSYQNISNTLYASYWPATMAYWERADQQEGCLLPTESMYLMLIEYIARDKLEEGWARLEPRLCSPETDGSRKDNLDELREWVAQQLEHSSR